MTKIKVRYEIIFNYLAHYETYSKKNVDHEICVSIFSVNLMETSNESRTETHVRSPLFVSKCYKNIVNVSINFIRISQYQIPQEFMS
jgi:hypothetical protein